MRNPLTALFRRSTADPETRAVSFLPWASGGNSSAFVDQDRALRLVPVFAATRLLANSVSTLPLKTYRRLGDERAPMSTLPALFDQLSVEGQLVNWLHRCMASLVLRGNAFGLITARDGFQFPTKIDWLDPSAVTVDDRRMNDPIWYLYGNQIPRGDLVHIPWYTVPGKTLGLSPIQAYATTINTGLNAMSYGNTWFENGGFPPGTFQNAELTLTQEDADRMRQRLTSAIRSGEPLVYGRDWTYNPITVSPDESQFIATAKLTANQIASIYGIPPEMIGGETGSSMCVDTETEILTARGWLRYDEVVVSDTCLTLNVSSGLAEWQRVEAVYVFGGPHDVVRIQNGTHSSVTTPDHRWPVRREGCAELEWRQTQTLVSSDRILAAAPAVDAPVEPKWSDALVELVAWFYTEGYINPSNGVTIAQSHKINPENCARIRAAMVDTFGPATTAKHVRSTPTWAEDIHPAGVTKFRLNQRAARCLLAVAPEKVPTVEFLRELTRAQLELFIAVSIDADGSVTNFGTPVLGQKDKRRLEAFQVACALTGRSGVLRQNASGMWSMAVQTTASRKPIGHAEYVTRERIDGPVWCPTTPNRTWFARRSGTTYFTGNTYANVEQQQINFVMFTLRPWLVVLEHAFTALLPERQYVRFNADALIRADLATRWSTYQIATEIGAKSVDDVRKLEDEPPLPNGAGADYNTPAAKAARAPVLVPVPDSPDSPPADTPPQAERMWVIPA